MYMCTCRIGSRNRSTQSIPHSVSIHTHAHICAISTFTRVYIFVMCVGCAVTITALNAFVTQNLHAPMHSINIYIHTCTYVCNFYIYTCTYIYHVCRIGSRNRSTQFIPHLISPHTNIHILAISTCTHVDILFVCVGLAVATAALHALLTQYPHTHMYISVFRICRTGSRNRSTQSIPQSRAKGHGGRWPLHVRMYDIS